MNNNMINKSWEKRKQTTDVNVLCAIVASSSLRERMKRLQILRKAKVAKARREKCEETKNTRRLLLNEDQKTHEYVLVKSKKNKKNKIDPVLIFPSMSTHAQSTHLAARKSIKLVWSRLSAAAAAAGIVGIALLHKTCRCSAASCYYTIILWAASPVIPFTRWSSGGIEENTGAFNTSSMCFRESSVNQSLGSRPRPHPVDLMTQQPLPGGNANVKMKIKLFDSREKWYRHYRMNKSCVHVLHVHVHERATGAASLVPWRRPGGRQTVNTLLTAWYLPFASLVVPSFSQNGDGTVHHWHHTSLEPAVHN